MAKLEKYKPITDTVVEGFRVYGIKHLIVLSDIFYERGLTHWHIYCILHPDYSRSSQRDELYLSKVEHAPIIFSFGDLFIFDFGLPNGFKIVPSGDLANSYMLIESGDSHGF